MADGSRILIVDDELGIRQVIKTNLVMQGHETLEAKNGQQCLDILSEEEVDLVILDVMMPGTNGWEVLEFMRDHPEMAGTPVMLLTAVTTEESKVKGFELGAADYLVKPFAVGELLARVQRILSEKHEREALAEFSITDWVTGLFNRRYLELRLGQEISRSHRYSAPLAGIFFDIDQLPEIHESDGPKLIDALLGQLAVLLRGQIRACDLVFRYDGDFFFVLLPDTDEAGAFEVAERIRRSIATESWAEERQLTASIGVRVLGEDEGATDFMSGVEAALQNAKLLGGDAIWSPFAQVGGKRAEEVEQSSTPLASEAIDQRSELRDEITPPDSGEKPERQVSPQPAAPSIPLPTAQTQVLHTDDLHALRAELTQEDIVESPSPVQTPTQSHSVASETPTTTTPAVGQAQGPPPVGAPEPRTHLPYSATAGLTSDATADAGISQPNRVSAEQAQIPQVAPPGWGLVPPAIPSQGDPALSGMQPPPAPQTQPQADAVQPPAQPPIPVAETPQQVPHAPASWADAQMLAATQYSVSAARSTPENEDTQQRSTPDDADGSHQ